MVQNKIIHFDKNTYSRLLYGVNSSAIEFQPRATDRTIDIVARNSRGRITPGYINIPMSKLPELISKLQELNQDLANANIM